MKIKVPIIVTNDDSSFEKLKVKITFERKVENYRENGEVGY